MKEDRLRRISIRSFVIPVVLLSVVFSIITYFDLRSHINKSYREMEKYSLSLADSLLMNINKSNIATEIITDLIDEKLMMTGRLILDQAKEGKDLNLADLAEKYSIDQIAIYDRNAKIQNSTRQDIIGQLAYEDHPIHDFLSSDEKYYLEDDRVGIISGTHYRMLYLKDSKDLSVQVGLAASQVDNFLFSFDLNETFKEFTRSEYVENVFFTDVNFQLLAQVNSDYAGTTFGEDEIHKHFLSDTPQVGKDFISQGLLHVCAPVFHEGERLGTLTVVWSSKLITQETNKILIDRIFRFAIVALLVSSILFYAYRKRKLALEAAYYNQLTNLPNQNYLKDFLEKKIENCKNEKTAVLMLNLTNFSLVNLLRGLDYGDRILKSLGNLYCEYLANDDMLFHLYADQFVMVVNDYGDVGKVENLVTRIIQDYNKPSRDQYQHEYLNLNISIYELCNDQDTVSQILHDLRLGVDALEKDKSKAYNIFAQDMRQALIRDQAIERAMTEILSGDETNDFHLCFQPLINLETNKLDGFESLARLHLPDLGQISPIDFIDIAEKRNLIYPLGRIILEKAFNFLAELGRLGRGDLRVSVNVSVLQLLRPEFVTDVKELIDLYQIDSSKLVFEITETTLVANYDLINSLIDEFRALGIFIGLDDFGTGYSSLAELSNMNIDTLKIDQSFISRIGHNELLITQDIIAMAHRLGLLVVAEGVETQQQLDYLKKHGCDLAQGYLISKPLSKSDAIEFVENY